MRLWCLGLGGGAGVLGGGCFATLGGGSSGSGVGALGRLQGRLFGWCMSSCVLGVKECIRSSHSEVLYGVSLLRLCGSRCARWV